MVTVIRKSQICENMEQRVHAGRTTTIQSSRDEDVVGVFKPQNEGQGSGDAMSQEELVEGADRAQTAQTHGCLVRRGIEI